MSIFDRFLKFIYQFIHQQIDFQLALKPQKVKFSSFLRKSRFSKNYV
ncbi:hypothetical protein EcB7A_2307, partial [Escherichia coli B7A]